MSRPVFDMNVFVEYESVLTEKDIAKMALSAVVLYELTATTIDKTRWQKYIVWRKAFTELDRYLVPTSEDWGKQQNSFQELDSAKNPPPAAKLRKFPMPKDSKMMR